MQGEFFHVEEVDSIPEVYPAQATFQQSFASESLPPVMAPTELVQHMTPLLVPERIPDNFEQTVGFVRDDQTNSIMVWKDSSQVEKKPIIQIMQSRKTMHRTVPIGFARPLAVNGRPGVYIDGMWEHNWPHAWKEGDPVPPKFWSVNMCREVLFDWEDGVASFLVVFKKSFTQGEFMNMLHSVKPLSP